MMSERDPLAKAIGIRLAAIEEEINMMMRAIRLLRIDHEELRKLSLKHYKLSKVSNCYRLSKARR